MRETEYTYAVARIRANEQKMLSKSDLDLLISSDSYDAALRILSDKGWPDAAGGSVYDICELEMKKTRDFIAESVPDIKVFNALGQLMHLGTENTIEVTAWPEGVYFVRIVDENDAVTTVKLIKQN